MTALTDFKIGVIPPMTLGTRLRMAREFAGLDQRDLARDAGISRTTISTAERGVSHPNRATVTLWAWACGVDPEWLRTGVAPSTGESKTDYVTPAGRVAYTPHAA